MAKPINDILTHELHTALEYLKNDETPVAPSLLFSFSDLNRQELAEFARTWTELPAVRRRAVAVEMAEFAEERFEADFDRIFRYLLDDEDAEVRETAINGLWEDEDPALGRVLIGALRSDASARVRAAAAEALGRFVLLAETSRIPAAEGDEIRTALLASIRNLGEDELVRRRAIEAIAYIGDEMVRDIVTVAYSDDDPKMRASAVFAMGRSADSYWKRTAAQELFSPDPKIRFEAARAVGELEFKAAVPRLIELLDDGDREVQSAAIISLGQIGGKEAKEALIAVLEGDDEAAREIAQDALDELEFSSGSQLLLYDIGLTNEDDEDEILEDEFGESNEELEEQE